MSNARDFAEALKLVDKGNEVLVTTKDPSAPRVSPAALEAVPLRRPGVVGTARATQGESRRSSLVRAPSPSPQVRGELISAIEEAGGEVYRSVAISPVLGIRFEDASADPVLKVLLTHPAVDFFEANEIRPIYPDGSVEASAPAEPVGSNELDIKHFFHSVADTLSGVEDAWDYTRGDGVTIGVIDSGMTGTSSGDWHVDADSTTSGGIIKRGFSDDYSDDCDPPNGQSNGECIARDDHGHGTQMAGLIGANDNNIRSVGIAPEARVVSMKVAMNCHVVMEMPDGAHDDCDHVQLNVDDGWQIETDDFEAAVTWASSEGLDILSMSFSMDVQTTVYTALQTAYSTYDIAMFSSTGNGSPSPDEPQSFSFVMGVGGLNLAGGSYGLEAYQEVSALSAGTTLGEVSCRADRKLFCDQASTPKEYGDTLGETSASTAITAGIAGLVLSENPSMTPDDIYDRLVETSEGPHDQVNAWRAVSGTFFLDLSPISGSNCLEDEESEMWSVNAFEGVTPYSYAWEVDFDGETIPVGTGSSYTATMGEEEWFGEEPESEAGPFLLRVTVTDDVDDEQVEELDVGFDDGGLEGCQN